MTIRVGLRGSKELKAALRGMSKEIEAQVSKAVVGTALEVEGDIVRAIQSGPASGRIYEKYNPRRTHQASAPGQAPMSDTGGLVSSIYTDHQDKLTSAVASNSLVALWMEYGTRNMAPRPIWQKTADEAAPRFQARVEKALGVAVR